jgi:hypothetical protein
MGTTLGPATTSGLYPGDTVDSIWRYIQRSGSLDFDSLLALKKLGPAGYSLWPILVLALYDDRTVHCRTLLIHTLYSIAPQRISRVLGGYILCYSASLELADSLLVALNLFKDSQPINMLYLGHVVAVCIRKTLHSSVLRAAVDIALERQLRWSAPALLKSPLRHNALLTPLLHEAWLTLQASGG